MGLKRTDEFRADAVRIALTSQPKTAGRHGCPGTHQGTITSQLGQLWQAENDGGVERTWSERRASSCGTCSSGK